MKLPSQKSPKGYGACVCVCGGLIIVLIYQNSRGSQLEGHYPRGPPEWVERQRGLSMWEILRGQ